MGSCRSCMYRNILRGDPANSETDKIKPFEIVGVTCPWRKGVRSDLTFRCDYYRDDDNRGTEQRKY